MLCFGIGKFTLQFYVVWIYTITYLNSTINELNIKLGNDTKIQKVNIYNIKCEKVFSGEFDSSYAKIDVSGLVSGVYIITILKVDGTILNEKVIKE